MLCNLHPELLTRLGTRRLVGVVSRHVRIVNLKSFLDCLGIGIHHAVEDDLSLLDHIDIRIVFVFILLRLYFQLLNLALTDIYGVVDFEKDRLALLLVSLFFLKTFNQFFQVFAVNVEIEGHVMHSFCCRTLDLDAIFGEEVTRLPVGPVRNLMHGWDQRLKLDITEIVCPQCLQSFFRLILEEN